MNKFPEDDFDGDGKPDLAMLGDLAVSVGNGDGTFKPAVKYGTEASKS